MFPTVMATESEYGVTGKKFGTGLIPIFATDTDLVSEFVKKGLPPEVFSRRLDYLNSRFGARDASQFYLDTGGHFEWACREELGPGNAALAQIAGDLNMEEACLRANKAWEEEGRDIKLFFLRNNLDTECAAYDDPQKWESHSYGCHENYLIKHSVAIHRKIWEILGPYFIARIALVGGGWLCIHRGKLLYLLSPRAAVTFNAHTGGTTAHRSVINTRDESHSPEGYMRLHLTMGDSLILEPARYMQLAMSEMLLDAVEEGFLNRCPVGTFDDRLMLRAKDIFNEDASLKAEADLGVGRKLSALDILEIYYEDAKRFCEETGRLDGERRLTLELWGAMLAKGRKARPHEELAPYTDWASKLLGMEIDADRHGYAFEDRPRKTVSGFKEEKKRKRTVFERLKEIEFMFALLDPGKGLARLLEREGKTKRLFSKDLIARARYAPLSKCRSWARYEELRALDAYAERTGITLKVTTSWTNLVARTPDNEVLYSSGGKDLSGPVIRDPFDYHCDVSDLLT